MMHAPRIVPSFSLCVAVSVAALCASASQPAWAQCSDPLARMWDNVKGPTNTNDQPGRIEVKFTACGDTGGPTSLGVRAWVYSSNGWYGRPTAEARTARDRQGRTWLRADVWTGGYQDQMWLRRNGANRQVYIYHKSLDSKPSAHSWHNYKPGR
jgi:hypothetical protein